MSVPCSGSGSVKAGGCDEGPGICSVLLTLVSVILVIATLPFSLLLVVKVVQVKVRTKLVPYVFPICPHPHICVRNMRGPWYSGSGCCWPEVPGDPGCSSSCPVSMSTRKLTCGPRHSMFLHKRFSPRTVSLCLSMQLCIIRSEPGQNFKTSRLSCFLYAVRIHFHDFPFFVFL